MFDLLRQPGFFGTHATLGADLSQLMAALFTGLFIIGWFQAKRHRGHGHHWLMLGGMVAMVGFFTAYYLFRQLGVLAFEGKEGFGGSQALYDYVFIPVLTVHIILVIIGLVMAVYMIVLGFRSQQFISGARMLSEALLQTSWKKVSLIFVGLTAVVAAVIWDARDVRRIFHAEDGGLSLASHSGGDCLCGRNGHSAHLARWGSAASRPGPIYDDRILYLVSDRNLYLRHAVYPLSREDRLGRRGQVKADMLVCGCGRWMHTEGVEERIASDGTPTWFVRSECRPCRWLVGIDVPVGRIDGIVDRLMWSDDARHRLDRVPPYAVPVLRELVEGFARMRQQRVITYDLIDQAQTGDVVSWDPDAEQRLANVPAAVRAMARIELERTAVDRGAGRVTVALMEEVKARYFGMAAQRDEA